MKIFMTVIGGFGLILIAMLFLCTLPFATLVQPKKLRPFLKMTFEHWILLKHAHHEWRWIRFFNKQVAVQKYPYEITRKEYRRYWLPHWQWAPYVGKLIPFKSLRRNFYNFLKYFGSIYKKEWMIGGGFKFHLKHFRMVDSPQGYTNLLGIEELRNDYPDIKIVLDPHLCIVGVVSFQWWKTMEERQKEFEKWQEKDYWEYP